jgi:hypothetical protein
MKRISLGIALLVVLAAVGAFALRRGSDAPAERRGDSAAEPVRSAAEPERAREGASIPVGAGESRSEIALAAPEDPPALRGRFVYASTGEPLPWFVFALHGAGGSELLTTDAGGAWRTGTSRSPPLSAVLHGSDPPRTWSDEAMRALTISLPEPVGGVVAEVAVEAWPTFLLEGLDDEPWTGRIDWEHWENEQHDAPVRVAADGSRYWRPAYARFGTWIDAYRRLCDAGPPLRLRFLRADGRLRALGDAPELEGVVEVPLAFEELGAVELDVRTAFDAQPSWRVEARLQPAAAHEHDFRDGDVRELQLADPARAPLRWDALAPGDYVARVRTAFCRPLEVPIRVAGGATARESAVLDCPEPRGSIVVEVASQSGATQGFHAGAWCPLAQDFVQPPLVERRERDLVFEFRDRPDCEHDVWIDSDFPVAPARRVRARPGDRLSFQVLDLAPEVGVGFLAYDASSGAPIEAFEIQVFGVHTFHGARAVRSGEVLIEKWPDGARLDWRASVAGYRCEDGSFETSPSSLSEGVRWIELRFEPGWSANVHVDDPDGHRVEGATVFADGVEVGISGAEGALPLRLAARPARLTARHPSWREGAAAPDHLAAVGPCWGVAIRLERP